MVSLLLARYLGASTSQGTSPSGYALPCQAQQHCKLSSHAAAPRSFLQEPQTQRSEVRSPAHTCTTVHPAAPIPTDRVSYSTHPVPASTSHLHSAHTLLSVPLPTNGLPYSTHPAVSTVPATHPFSYTRTSCPWCLVSLVSPMPILPSCPCVPFTNTHTATCTSCLRSPWSTPCPPLPLPYPYVHQLPLVSLVGPVPTLPSCPFPTPQPAWRPLPGA